MHSSVSLPAPAALLPRAIRADAAVLSPAVTAPTMAGDNRDTDDGDMIGLATRTRARPNCWPLRANQFAATNRARRGDMPLCSRTATNHAAQSLAAGRSSASRDVIAVSNFASTGGTPSGMRGDSRAKVVRSTATRPKVGR